MTLVASNQVLVLQFLLPIESKNKAYKMSTAMKKEFLSSYIFYVTLMILIFYDEASLRSVKNFKDRFCNIHNISHHIFTCHR